MQAYMKDSELRKGDTMIGAKETRTSMEWVDYWQRGGDRAYTELTGAEQQAVDLWMGDRISWDDVPQNGRDFLIARNQAGRFRTVSH